MKKIRTYLGLMFHVALVVAFGLIKCALPTKKSVNKSCSAGVYDSNGFIAYLTPNGVLRIPYACDEMV
jgi:hypothetical protein